MGLTAGTRTSKRSDWRPPHHERGGQLVGLFVAVRRRHALYRNQHRPRPQVGPAQCRDCVAIYSRAAACGDGLARSAKWPWRRFAARVGYKKAGKSRQRKTDPTCEPPKAEAQSMISLYEDPVFTFRFEEDRLVDRFQLEGVPFGALVVVCQWAADAPDGAGPELARWLVGDGGWVTAMPPLLVRAGGGFVVRREAL